METKKVIWRANQVISIETKRKDENRKENVYVLAQMINKAQLLVFNLFNMDNKWENVNLKETPILFCKYVTRQFIRCSNVYKQKIEPLTDYQPPEYQIHMKCSPGGDRQVTLWKGTPNEKTIWVMGEGGGWLIRKGDINDIVSEVSFEDNDTIDKYELSTISIYAELNERLYLCYKLGKNVDPQKDLVFNRPIPLEYKEYIDIISS